ncbi:DUF429 domain-containing protein [Xanthomonas vesicatoria]|uniref:DUF429 domain-containing protein n=1 Tax=Xanthomonas vesicatoria TaxID=56460 RepID=UPI001E2B2CA6|nr:DUF429 domain-containing protein [Xanthomonas vesicatoria]MCC8625172.1 DUF429 domain-containing protein [Xanthomonas vesicatoria]MDG4481641.1 DUF429 domain-containing protein [Xanthomonas vesicatoria]
MERQHCVGVDGARSGWIAVWENGDALAFAYYATVAELAVALREVEVLGVDVPLGLAEHAPRAADVQARRYVGGRRACSIFAAPLRGILQAETQVQASALHRVLDHEKHRGFGVQSFALLPKIRDWDTALRADHAWAARVFEVHPEVSFAALAGGQGLAAPKKSDEGHRQRRTLLGDHYGAARVASLLERVPRACVQPDDVLDALVACWSAQRIAAGTAGSLPAVVERDACGLRMGIYY